MCIKTGDTRMKSLLASAILLALPLSAMSKKHERPYERPLEPGQESDIGEPDLFKKYDQIVSANVQFLYWTIAEGGLDYALKMKADAWGPEQSYAQGSFQRAGYNVDPGFRLGFLYFRAPHYWESRWEYTRMTNRGENHSVKPKGDGKFLTGTWPQITPNPLSEAHSRIHFNYNVFDWLISRVWIPNPHLRFKMLCGATTAWMDQDWELRYTDTASNTTKIRNRWDFAGGGLKAGTMWDWYWTGDLYFTGQGFLGLLMGGYSNHAKQTTTYQPTESYDPSIPVRNGSYSDVRATVTAQMLIGPSYQKNLPKNRIEVFAGFEMNVWANLQEIYRSTTGVPSDAKETWINSSMLALYGLTTRISVDF